MADILNLSGAFFVAGTVELCYNHFAADSFQRKEVKALNLILSFLISVMASVIAYYICKWLDGDDD